MHYILVKDVTLDVSEKMRTLVLAVLIRPSTRANIPSNEKGKRRERNKQEDGACEWLPFKTA